MWAVSTRSDPSRDLVVVSDTPIDYLDFASPKSGLGGKMGIDATNKIGAETSRPWGEVLAMDPAVIAWVDAMWDELGDFVRPLYEPSPRRRERLVARLVRNGVRRHWRCVG